MAESASLFQPFHWINEQWIIFCHSTFKCSSNFCFRACFCNSIFIFFHHSNCRRLFGTLSIILAYLCVRVAWCWPGLCVIQSNREKKTGSNAVQYVMTILHRTTVRIIIATKLSPWRASMHAHCMSIMCLGRCFAQSPPRLMNRFSTGSNARATHSYSISMMVNVDGKALFSSFSYFIVTIILNMIYIGFEWAFKPATNSPVRFRRPAPWTYI